MTMRSRPADEQLLGGGGLDASNVSLDRVEPTVRRLGHAVHPSAEPTAASMSELSSGSIASGAPSVSPRRLAAGVAGASIAFGIVSAWSGDVRVPVMLLFGATCFSVLRVVEGRTRLSFGQGFIGYRPDGWPVGVQEDDDVHWSWQSPPPVARDAGPEVELLDRT